MLNKEPLSQWTDQLQILLPYLWNQFLTTQTVLISPETNKALVMQSYNESSFKP